MNRKAFLLGFFSIGAQILIIRELIAAFHGDELFIGTALFGWLIAVALGAWLWELILGRIKATALFVIAIAILPVDLILIRFSPLLFVDSILQTVPFTKAALISIVLSIPVGFISGALFPAITHEGHRPAKSVSRVYLFEGFGAFIGGLVVTALVGKVFDNLGMAIAISIVTLIYSMIGNGRKSIAVASIALAVLLIAVFFYTPSLSRYTETKKYFPFELVDSFETPYGHQAILKNQEVTSLITDNAIEGSSPDIQTAENLMIPALAFKPDAENVLIIGRAEFGAGEIARKFPNMKVTAIDPREGLNHRLDRALEKSPRVIRINDDPVGYLLSHDTYTPYDIIIIAPSEPDNILYSRYFTGRFLSLCCKVLAPDGLLYVPTMYDTDRYVSPETAQLLSVIYKTLHHWFRCIDIWPGNTTGFLASGADLFELYNEQIFDRIDSLPYQAEYLNRYYLEDQLDSFRRERIWNAIDTTVQANAIEKPILMPYHAVYSSLTLGSDESIMRFLFANKFVLWIVPIIIFALFFLTYFKGIKHQTFGLFLFFTAGLLSLSLELVSVYLYQTMAGTVYSDIGLLFGAFMFGLALGTWYALRCEAPNLEFPSLLLLITISFIFLWSYATIPYSILLLYYILFLFVTGTATGTLFVAAAGRYYFGRADANRGKGYAIEIFGSAIGALLAVPVLLPLVGLSVLLISLMAVAALALIGAYKTS